MEFAEAIHDRVLDGSGVHVPQEGGGLAGVAQGSNCFEPLPGHLGAQVRMVDGVQDLAHGAFEGGR